MLPRPSTVASAFSRPAFLLMVPGLLTLACAVTPTSSGEQAATPLEPLQAPATDAGTAGGPPSVEAGAVDLRPELLTDARGPDARIVRLDERTWMHVTEAETADWGPVEANGLIVVGDRGAVLIDSGWTDEQAAWLLGLVRGATGREVLGLVVTHFHEDRAGGMATAAHSGIPVYAHARTVELLGAEGAKVDRPFEADTRIELGGATLELSFPGAGHTLDNTVVHVPESELLFGGCLVRPQSAGDLGNVADAERSAWGPTMESLMDTYPEVDTVIPGHGRPGDASLLAHTRELVRRAVTEGPSSEGSTSSSSSSKPKASSEPTARSKPSAH